jgi:hypothetical protein
MCVFEKPEFPDEAAPAPLPGNAAHVRSVLRQHTALSHALTPHPYRRPLQKMRRRREEASATRSANDGKTLLQSIAREIGAKGMRAAQSVPESLFSSDGGGLAGV